MRQLTEENIKFLTTLSTEMREQDSLCTAAPRLWVIRDVKMIPTSDDYADGYQAFDDDNCEDLYSEDLDEKILLMIEEEGIEVVNDFIKRNESMNLQISQLTDWDLDMKVELLGLFGNSIRLVPYSEEIFVTDTAGSFLTQKAAQEHINANKHHYTDKVHTYCIQSWRNPEIERLVDILEKTDWGQYTTNR